MLIYSHVRFYSNSEVRILWQLSHYIIMKRTKSSLNAHTDEASLISVMNRLMKFSKCIFFNNSNFNSIIRLHYSVLIFLNYNEFLGNLARHILQGKEGSYFFFKEDVVINISNKIVYTVYVYLYITTTFNRSVIFSLLVINCALMLMFLIAPKHLNLKFCWLIIHTLYLCMI